MKRNHLFRPILVLVLICLALPLVVFGQDNHGDATTQEAVVVAMPQPATPLQLGQTIELQSDGSRAARPTIPEGNSIPATPTGGEQEVGTLAVLPDNPEVLYPSADLRDTGSPDANAQCYTYIYNGNFEINQYWSGQGDVQYAPGGYQGNRSLYMSTYNRTDAYLWQTVSLPAQAQSVFVRFTNYQNFDPGETLYAAIYNATNTQVLASKVMNSVQGSWHTLDWTLPANQFLGQTVNLVFVLQNDGDDTYSQLWLDNVEFVACDTPVTPTATTRKIDLVFSIERSVPQNERWKYESVARYAADAIFEMSEGRHYLGKITFYQNWQNFRNAHISWEKCEWPNAMFGGYVRPYYQEGTAWHKIKMGDRVPSQDNKNDNSCIIGTDSFANLKSTGYTLAHELGHYFYGLADEYCTWNGRDCAPLAWEHTPQWSVMNSQHCALTPTQCFSEPDAYYLYWLNFSHDINFDVSNPIYRQNNQYQTYQANAWDTLVRDPRSDPQSAWLNNQPRRTLYPELAQVAPQPGKWPTIQISGGNSYHPEADRYFATEWVPTLREDEPLYSANIAVASGNETTYPQPALLVAHLSRRGQSIAKAGLVVQVTAPNGTQSTLTLKDDGVAPDYLVNDGQYSAILQYNQNGNYLVKATFSNTSGQAAYTSVGQLDIPWTLGNLVGESFNATTETQITISGYTGDDHKDQLANATTILSDNQPVRGQIDRAGDKDIFKSTLIGDGTFVLRLSSLALGIQPRLRLWQSDGTTLIGDWTIIPEEGYYYYIRLTGSMGASFYAEITHAKSGANQGMYEISFGPPLTGEGSANEEEGNLIFLPSTIR